MVGLGSELLERYPYELSGGQRQRVCIARALALKTKILILDEPTSALDAKTASDIIKLLKKLQKRLGISYIFISHDLKLVRKISDRIIVMKDGRIVEEGTPEQIWKDPQETYTSDLIAASCYKLK